MFDSKVMLTTGDVAQLLGLHPNTVRRWSKRGILKSYRITPRGDRRFRREDVDNFLRGRGKLSNIARIIKERRVMIPLTLRELAAKSGVSTSHLVRMERGERSPSARVLQKIAKPLGFDEGELFTHAGYLSPSPTGVESETQQNLARLDPYVASVLSQEPVETQRTVIGILVILKSMARGGS